MTAEQLSFQHEAFFYLGVVYAALWILWVQKSTLVLSGLVGSLFALTASVSWGVGLIGTALPLGLCLGLALVNRASAICFFISALFLRPWELIPGDAILSLLPRLSLLLCGVHFVLLSIHLKTVALDRSKLAAALLGLVLWCWLSTWFAPDVGVSQDAFGDGLFKSAVVYFVVVGLVRSRVELKQLGVTLLISFLFIGLMSLIQGETDSRLNGFGAFKNSNDLAAILVWILPFSVFTALRGHALLGTAPGVQWQIIRWMSGALSGVALVAIVMSKSRGAMIAVAVMAAVYLLMRWGRRAVVPIAIGGVALAFCVSLLLATRGSEDLDGSSAGRITYLKAGLRMGAKNPIFGVGFDAYSQSLAAYSTESLEESSQMTAHNSFILVFAECGLVGLLLFGYLYFKSLADAKAQYAIAPEYFLALSGYGVAMVFLSHSYLIYPYLLYGLNRAAKNVRAVEAL